MGIKVMSVFGTRPEAVKMLPLVKKLAQTGPIDSLVCVTAQHREMLDQVLAAFGIRPDFDLDIMMPHQTLSDITARVLSGLQAVLADTKPDLVLVHGDTSTSFAAALAAFYHRIPIGHVEAGLRTFDPNSPFPEEMNRCLTGRLATLHFAPTEQNAKNLRAENITQNIHVTGNTVIDALRSTVRPDYAFVDETLQAIDFYNHRTLLLTAHRRENLGAPLRSIFQAVHALADAFPDLVIIYPMHKNPEVRRPAREFLSDHPRISLIEPLGVTDMHNLMARCTLVLTDSGGLQEEAPALGKPVLVLRTETERPEAVSAGVAKIVGVEKGLIMRETARLLQDPAAYAQMATAQNPYGDGHASERIVQAILTYFHRQ